MRIAFLASDKPRERELADAFLLGARRFGHETQVIPLGQVAEHPEGYDIACMVGVKSREIFLAHWKAGIRVFYFDKGYSRHSRPGPLAGWEYWRLAIDGHQPTKHLVAQQSPDDRLSRLGLTIKPWRKEGDQIVLAGSTPKYHAFYGLAEPTEFWTKKVREIRGHSARRLIYRPKPTWLEAQPIPKTVFSRPPQTLTQDMDGAHCLVTHGSNACFDALLSGIPTVIIGDGVTRPISTTDLAAIEHPRVPTDDQRLQLLANLAYWQWTLAEMATGDAWRFLETQLYAV